MLIVFYDILLLIEMLESLIDFDFINYGFMCFSVGVVEIESVNFCYFDSV